MRNKRRLLYYSAPVLFGGGVSYFPYSIDFSVEPDGALPAEFTNTGWSVASGVAASNPTIGAEILADPGLEANYTAGLCDSLTKSGSPTVAQSADVHGGSKAQEFTAVAANNNINYATATVSALTWYKASLWEKRTAGTSNKLQIKFNGLTIIPILPLTDAAYTQKAATAFVASGVFRRIQINDIGSSGYETCIVDDYSIKDITKAHMFALLPATRANVTAKAGLTITRGFQSGVIARADATSNPSNYLIAMVSANSTATADSAALYKCLSGVYTYLTGGSITYAAGRVLEIRCNGTSVSLWYNNTQVGTTQTLTSPGDDAVINGTIHGMFSSDGGNSLNSFFSHSPTVYTDVFLGGSNTSGIDTNNGFAIYTHNNIVERVTAAYNNKGAGGADSWYGLVRLQADVIDLAPDVVFIEQAVNDPAFEVWASDRANGWWPCAEALIRRLRTALPNARLVFVNLVQQEEFVSADYITSRDNWIALCNKYDVEDYRIDLWLQDVIGDPTPTQAQCEVYGDFVHFTLAGHTQIAAMLEPHLSGWFPHTSAGWTGDLDDYNPPTYADIADFTQTPIIRNGTDNDGETGTGWSTSGTSRQSSTAGDTISWTGTFTAFGLDGTQGAGYQMTYAIDGGAEVAFNFGTGAIVPLRAIARAEHTVVFKVVAGNCKIDRFLAI